MLDRRVAGELAACVAPGAAPSAADELTRFADPTGGLPELVLLPTTAAEVSAVLQVANRVRVRVVPRGAGTSDPERAPVAGAVVLSSGRLNRVVTVDTANLTAAVEPGVRLGEFQLAIEKLGLFFPPDPLNLEVATFGGATAVDARGPRALKYGSLKDYVLGLEAVLADGTALRTGANTVKSASGYDLTRLFTGSRGTLCVYTRIMVRLLPQPAARRTLAFTFAGLEAAVRVAVAVIAAKVLPARLEVLDRLAAVELGDACPIRLLGDAGALLLCELDGSKPGVTRQAELVAGLAGPGGADEEAALASAEGDALWVRLRGLRAHLARGRAAVGEMAVPRGRQAELLGAIEALRSQHGVPVGLVARPGTGGLGFALSAEPRGPDEAARLTAFGRAVQEAAGSLTVATGPPRNRTALELVRGLKAAYDPHGILNPRFRIPDGAEAERSGDQGMAPKWERIDGG